MTDLTQIIKLEEAQKQVQEGKASFLKFAQDSGFFYLDEQNNLYVKRDITTQYEYLTTLKEERK